MDWREVTIYTTTEGIGPVEAVLEDNGIEGYVLEDAADFEEFLKDTEIYWDYVDEDLVREKRAQETCLKIYLSDDEAGAKQYAALRTSLENLKARDEEHAWGRLVTETALTRQEDWEWGWKQYFKPFTVDDILIKPTWETVPEEHKDKLLIQIDPGTAFGTGMHETTQLCIRQLEKYVTPDSEVLDVGTGSGILGITALKLGAKHVFGTDLDENAITAVGENLEANGIAPEQFKVVQGNIIDDKAVQDEVKYEYYDIAVANILADVIIMLQKEIPVHIKKNGIFITSGIIDMKEEAVKAAFEANDAFEIVEITHQGEWVSVTARKK